MRIAILPGDGIGPEVTEVAFHVLRHVLSGTGHKLSVTNHLIGWAAIASDRDPLPKETVTACLEADAVFLGAVGDPAGDSLPPEERPEAGLLRLRKALGCYANLRPLKAYPALLNQSPLKEAFVRGTDCLVVRELSGGLYYGDPRGWDREGERAWNTLTYNRSEVERIARVAFSLARDRRGKLTSIDKANVLEVCQLWRSVVDQVAEEFPDVACEHMLVDRAAMELVVRPSQFDVMLTPNLFGDILSDEGSVIGGSLGLLGSASLGGTTDLYEPVHGSAPDIAGRDIANPIGAIESVALMLRYTFQLRDEADRIDEALDRVLSTGSRTADLVGDSGETPLGTRALGETVVATL